MIDKASHEEACMDLVREALALIRENMDEDSVEVSVEYDPSDESFEFQVRMLKDGFVRNHEFLKIKTPHEANPTMWSFFVNDSFPHPIQVYITDVVNMVRMLRLCLDRI